MKKLTSFIAAALATTVCFTACKNDRGDDTHMDTTTVTATPDPYQSGSTPVKDSMSGVVDTVRAESSPLPPPPPEKKKQGETVSSTRERKTSRKGRIILASLNSNNADRMEADREGVYNRAEIMPSFPGGEKALRKFIERSIQYPEQALDNETEGTVRVSFAVDEQGKVYKPSVVSGRLGYGLEEEALRVVQQMPKWSPGQIKGKNVKTRFTLPITYQISDL